METMKDSLKYVGYVFMEIPSGILLADIFARTIYWRSSMQNLNLFVMVREYLTEWIMSWSNLIYFKTSYDAKMLIKQLASYSYLKIKPISSEDNCHPHFFLFLAHFSWLFRLTAHQGWEGGGA